MTLVAELLRAALSGAEAIHLANHGRALDKNGTTLSPCEHIDYWGRGSLKLC